MQIKMEGKSLNQGTFSSNEQVTIGQEITRAKGDAPPTHYTLKIQKFSELSEVLRKNGLDKYESGAFEVDGCHWKLVVYPKGNAKRNGSDHLSLYLVLVETSAILSNSPVLATLKFYVYDHILDKYLTIQDFKIKRYSAFKTEHGFSELLPLRIFTDSSNGYLDNDCCVFGVEVHILKFASKGEELKIVKEPENVTYTWKIKKFSTLQSEQFSEVFTFAGYRWNLVLYPKGDSRVNGRSLSFFLNLDFKNARPGSRVYVEYKLLVKDQINGKHQVGAGTKWFSDSAYFSGFSSFLMLSFLHSKSHGFLVDDTLEVEVKFDLISLVQGL